MPEFGNFRRGIDHLFRGASPAERQRRSRSGLVGTALMLPFLLGVMGCFELPAPIGDPERSRIEPGISGIWLDDGGELDGLMMVFEPYDRRTWLMRWIELDTAKFEDDPEPDEDAVSGEQIELEDDAEVALDPSGDRSTMDMLRGGDMQVGGVALFKMWRKRISGKSFFTMEFRGQFSSETAMEPSVWWGAKMRLADEDHLEVHFIDKDFDEIEDEMTRSRLERVIRRHHDNPELYSGENPLLLTRVRLDDYDTIAEMFDDMGLMATYD